MERELEGQCSDNVALEGFRAGQCFQLAPLVWRKLIGKGCECLDASGRGVQCPKGVDQSRRGHMERGERLSALRLASRVAGLRAGRARASEIGGSTEADDRCRRRAQGDGVAPWPHLREFSCVGT